MKFRKLIHIIYFAFFFSFNIGVSLASVTQDSLLEKANSLKFKHQDSAIIHLNKGYKLSLQKKDTVAAIKFLTSLSGLYAHQIDYEKSYDGYWEALLLADKSKDSISKANIYLGLGWLYTFYKRNNEALKYFNLSLSLRKSLINSEKVNNGFLIQNYFSFASFHRINKNNGVALKYLDSVAYVRKINPMIPEDFYSKSESGYLMALNGDYDNGLAKLNKALEYFKNNNSHYLVIIYALLGKIHRLKGDLSNSENYFKQSLKVSNAYNSHLDYRLFVFEELHKLYSEKKDFEKANMYLKMSKVLNEKMYSVQNNPHLFEIKDKYRIEQKRQEDIVKQQRILQLEQEDRISTLQFIILIASIVFITVFSYLTIRNIRNKHKNEKSLIKERQKERLKRHKEILEFKNKELTESALRLIEKDELIAGIKTKLTNEKNNIDINVIKRILKSIQGTPQSNWTEFEARFTVVNQSFYKELKSKFPNLKQTDLKICALVKLNFPSKDMAKLLGISVESVHTSRHRLRKKLGLNRNENLEEFINSF